MPERPSGKSKREAVSLVMRVLSEDLNRLFKSAYIQSYIGPDTLIFWTNGNPRIAKVLIQDDGVIRLERHVSYRKWEISYLTCGDPELVGKVRDWVSCHLSLS